jgi:hypothetical protein
MYYETTLSQINLEINISYDQIKDIYPLLGTFGQESVCVIRLGEMIFVVSVAHCVIKMPPREFGVPYL